MDGHIQINKRRQKHLQASEIGMRHKRCTKFTLRLKLIASGGKEQSTVYLTGIFWIFAQYFSILIDVTGKGRTGNLLWHYTKARWWTFYYVQVGLLNPWNPINISNVRCNKITRNSKIRNHRNYSFFYAIPHGASISIYNGSWKSISEVDHWSSFMFHCYEWNLSSMNTCCHAKYTTNVKGRTGFQGGCDFEKQREHVSNHLIFDAFGKGFLHHHCDLILRTILFFWRNLQKLAYSSLDLSDTHVKLLHVVDQVIAHIYG